VVSSFKLPSSWATETNFQSRYPWGIPATKIAELSGLLVFPTEFVTMALILLKGSALVFCARASPEFLGEFVVIKFGKQSVLCWCPTAPNNLPNAKDTSPN
jgi:hypothetical protein